MRPLSPLRAALIANGFAHNEYLLELNMCLHDPASRFPASRMFSSPISLDRYEDRLTVCHPLMLFEPFVMATASLLGVTMEIETEPPGGLNTIYHHCGDLADDKNYQDLIATIAYVTHRALLRGLVLGVKGGRLSTKNARQVAAVIGVWETEDRSEFNLSAAGKMLSPAFISNEASGAKGDPKAGKWAINLYSRKDPVGEFWAMVHGVEDGWFKKDKHGYFWMTDEGLARHNA